MIVKRTLLASVSLLTLCLISACASYKLGTHGSLPFKSIYITPVKQESVAPQAQAIVSAQIREAFIQDGRVRLVSSEEDADVVLDIKLMGYDRRAGARFREDTQFARTFNLTLTAEVDLFDNRSGDFLFSERELSEAISVYSDNPYATNETEQQSYIQAERNAMGRIARGIARRIADQVLSSWPTREDELAMHEAEKAAKLKEAAAETAEQNE